MNSIRNRVQIIGYPGADPEVKKFDNGQLATFRVATNDVYVNNNGEKKEDTQWHRVVAFGKLSEIVSNYVRKGEEVAVEGKLVTRQYEKDGEKRYSTEIHAQEILLLSKKPQSQSA